MKAAPTVEALYRVRLLGPLEVWRGRYRVAPFAYAKLTALLALLLSEESPQRREYVADMLWPEGGTENLRRALFDLRRALGERQVARPLIVANRSALALDADVLESDWSILRAAGSVLRSGVPPERLDEGARGMLARALRRWRGDFADGLVVADSADFEFWLAQRRATVTNRLVACADALRRWHEAAGDLVGALNVAELAAERVPDDARHVALARLLADLGRRDDATSRLQQHEARMRALGLPCSPELRAMQREIASSAKGVAPAETASTELDAITGRIEVVVRTRDALAQSDDLIGEARQRLASSRGSVPAGRRARLATLLFDVMFMRTPWADDMAVIVDEAERLLTSDLPPAQRMGLAFQLGVYHAWMGRAIRGAIVLAPFRALAEHPESPAAVRIGWTFSLGLCESCVSGDPVQAVRLATRGLKLAEEHRQPAMVNRLRAVLANGATVNGDFETADRALALMLRGDPPLTPWDHCNAMHVAAHLAIMREQWSRAVEYAEAGMALALRVGSPFQELSQCIVLGQARLLNGAVDEAAGPIARLTALATRIGCPGFLFFSHLLAAELALRGDRPEAGEAALAAGLAFGRRSGIEQTARLSGRIVGGLCGKALRRGTEIDYVRRLVWRNRLRPPAGFEQDAAWPWLVRIRLGAALSIDVRDEAVAAGDSADLVRKLAEAVLDGAPAVVDLDRAAVARVRRLIGRDAVMRAGAGYRLNQDLCRVDRPRP